MFKEKNVERICSAAVYQHQFNLSNMSNYYLAYIDDDNNVNMYLSRQYAAGYPFVWKLERACISQYARWLTEAFRLLICTVT